MSEDELELDKIGGRQCTMKAMNGMKIYMICPHMI